MRYFTLKENKLSELEGKTIKQIKGLKKYSEEVRILTECGRTYLFYHEQECCEIVTLEDFELSAPSLDGAVILSANEESSYNDSNEYGETSTWTFYKIGTSKGELWMRWFGRSNGYYSEAVNFIEEKTK